jgi:alkylation response protein AidB-like acyl-CoA dehydrogenase
MELEFSAAELAFRDEVRQFLDAKLPQRLRAGMRATPTIFAQRDIADEWRETLREQGWLTYQWPREYGGPGWSPVQRYIFEKECALADAPALPTMGLRLLAPVVYTFGTPAQKTHFLPRILTGEHRWCQGFSEPNAGSDLANLKTSAVRQGDRYVVNGTKLWTTHAQHSNWMFCLVRTDPQVKPQRGLSFLLIDMNQPGVRVEPIAMLAGDHDVNQVFLSDVTAHVRDRIGEEGQGWTMAKFLLENERGSSCSAPRLQALLATCRRAFDSRADRSAPGSMALASRLARLELEAQALEFTELRVLGNLAAGRNPGPQASVINLISAELYQRAEELALHVFGHAGLQLQTERPLYGKHARHCVHSQEALLAAPRYLNGRAWSIFGGSSEIQRNIIAQTVLGL